MGSVVGLREVRSAICLCALVVAGDVSGYGLFLYVDLLIGGVTIFLCFYKYFYCGVGL